jgi:lipoprotein-anchoring transpeptidase ErfK/SrfK
MVRSMGGWMRRHFVTMALVLVMGFALAGPAQAASPIDGVRAPSAEGSWIAKVLYPVAARSKPGAGRVIKQISNAPRYANGPNNLMVLGAAHGPSGRPFVKVHLPMRPNGTSAWVPADYVKLMRTSWRIEVSITKRQLTVRKNGEIVRQVKAVVGKPNTPTPRGLFTVAEKWKSPESYLGPWVVATSAYSNTFREFAGGPGVIAIHGRAGSLLSQPLGTMGSNGCIRVDNAHSTWIAKTLPAGTPIAIS